MGFVFDSRELGDYAKDFGIAREAIMNSVKEIAGNLIGKVDIKKETDDEGNERMEYDGDLFITVLQNIHVCRENADALIALVYDGYKLLAKEDAKNGKPDNETTNKEGE